MGSNIGGPFDYDYSVSFDDDYDDDDSPVLDAFIASLPTGIDAAAIKAFLIDKANILSYIIRVENGIHHIAQILKYNGLRIRLELNNTDWEVPDEMVASTRLSPAFRGGYEIHYLPK